MTYLIVATWDENKRPSRINEVPDLDAVNAWLAKNSERYPNAVFAERTQECRIDHVKVDEAGKTLIFDYAGHTAEVEKEVWVKEIAATDQEVTARTVEEIYEALDAPTQAKLSKSTKDTMAKRKEIRGRKPK